jgi:hypothetical protein
MTEFAQAHHLVRTIKEFWLDHGYPGIAVWVETRFLKDSHQGRSVPVIRSNIGPLGYPPASASKIIAMEQVRHHVG